MKILILGVSGMLGHRLFRVLRGRFQVAGTCRKRDVLGSWQHEVDSNDLIGNVYAEEHETVRNAIRINKPSVVVNCIGKIKQLDLSHEVVPTVAVNSLFPHQLAEICEEFGVRLITFSTDCVFSGLRGNYSEKDIPDPIDFYGRSKLLGELDRDHCLTLRGSLIGWEIRGFRGLLEWFARQRGRSISGYQEARFSGVSTQVMAEVVAMLIERFPDLSGIHHVGGEPINKFELLSRMREALGWTDIDIQPSREYICDRSLNSTRFEHATAWRAPAWSDMIEDLASDWPQYIRWRS